MYVIKRSGQREDVSLDKITNRIRNLCYDLDLNAIDPIIISQKVCAGLYKGVTTVELDVLAMETCAALAITYPDYATLSSRICVSNLHRSTSDSILDTVTKLYDYVHPATHEHAPLISKDYLKLIQKHHLYLQDHIQYKRDFLIDYFGMCTLQKSYLLKTHDKVIIERPQHLWLRVALAIHGEDLEAAIETYDLLSQKYYINATPTLYNSFANASNNQLSSCFLLSMQSDSIEGIYSTLKQTALISKSSGGVGLAVSDIRAAGSYIKGTGGTSTGLIPMLRNFNMTARYVDQGGGKRNGAFAIYLEPHHPDIFEFLELRKNNGKEEERCRDLFLALWLSNLFMERVEKDQDWSLFCPNECPGLSEVYGEKYVQLYEQYEKSGKAKRKTKARELWDRILISQTETGNPYLLNKDEVNEKNQQKNLGTIKCSNLCTEIMEYSSKDEVAVCTLASICLPSFIKLVSDDDEKDKQIKEIDYDLLKKVVGIVIRNLNKIIDRQSYCIPEAKRSSESHRPVGMGVTGFQDLLFQLGLPFDSPQAAELNKNIFETLYFAALTASNELAKEEGFYSSFPGSPASQGQLQFDLWGIQPSFLKWDWADLKKNIAQWGLRNSLLIALMPTASTAQIFKVNESIEPITSNLYVRRTMAGEFTVMNDYLIRDLLKLGLWNETMRDKIILEKGSIQDISSIPLNLKALYKTAWELSQKTLINLSADRSPFIDQSTSFNLFVNNSSVSKLTAIHFYSFKKKLKTLSYYIRTRAVTSAIAFTIDQSKLDKENVIDKEKEKKEQEKQLCSLLNREGCLSCSS